MSTDTPDLAIGTRVTHLDDNRVGTVRESWGHSAGVQWDDAQHAVPWYRSDALRAVDEPTTAPTAPTTAPTAPTDRQRAEMYRAEISKLRATLKGVVAQRDTLATTLLANYSILDSATTTVLSDLVESGNVTDHHGFLS